MSTRKPVEVIDKTFGVTYLICYGWPVKDINRLLARHKSTYSCDGCQGRTILRGNSLVIVWTLKRDVAVLVHECTHAVLFAMQERDTPHDDSTSELYAYLTERLIREGTKK